MRSVAAIGGSDQAVQTRQSIRELQVRLQAMENLVGRLIKNGAVRVKVNDLSDTNTKDLADGVLLQYNAATQEYVATAASSLTGVDADTLDGIDSTGFVKTDPGFGVSQEIDQRGNTELVVKSQDDTSYHPVLHVENATLKISNTPLGAPTWPPTTPGDGAFLIASRRITDPGAGGSTLNVVSDTGAVTRIDQPFLQRQNSQPATDGTQGYIWIDTSGATDRLYFLLSGVWELTV